MLNVDIENVKLGSGAIASRKRVSSNSSDIGFRGQEDPDRGLKAWFKAPLQMAHCQARNGASLARQGVLTMLTPPGVTRNLRSGSICSAPGVPLTGYSS